MKLVLIGGGGHCHSCIDVIEQQGTFKIVGILDKNITSEVMGHPVIGTDDKIPEFVSQGYSFLITVGQIKSAQIRMAIYDTLLKHNASIATIISPRAHIARNAIIGQGSIIMHDSLVNSQATIGENCIINTKALIEHDATIEDHCHISTGSIINGNTTVGRESFIGSNSVTRESITIPAKTILSAGSFFKG